MSELGGTITVSQTAPPPRPRRGMGSVGRHTLIYGAGVIASKLASFIMLPVYTRFLTPSDYGVLELISMTIEVIGTIAGMGVSQGIFKFYVHYQEAGEEGEIISTAAICTLAIGFVTASLGILFSPVLARLVFGHGPGSAPVYFRLFFLIYLLQSAEMVPLVMLRARNESVAFVAASVSKLVLQLALNILFVVVFRMSVLGVLISNLIVTAISATVLGAYTISRVGLRFSPTKFLQMARFGYPVMPWLLSNFILVFSDRYFLNHYAGSSVVGVYSLAYKFAFLLGAFAFGPFQMVWDPQRYAIARNREAPQTYARVFTYLNIALGGLAMLISLFVDDLLRIMAVPAFRGAAALVPVLLAAQVIYHWAAFCNIGLFLKDRTNVLGRLSFVSVALVLVLNALLIPRFGAWGAAFATLGGYGFRSIAVMIPSQRAYHVPYEWGRLLRLYAILIAAVLAEHATGPISPVASLVSSTLLALGAGTGVYTVVLTHDDRAALRGIIARSRAMLLAAIGA